MRNRILRGLLMTLVLQALADELPAGLLTGAKSYGHESMDARVTVQAIFYDALQIFEKRSCVVHLCPPLGAFDYSTKAKRIRCFEKPVSTRLGVKSRSALCLSR
jgi:hypothetical protein